MIGAGKLGHGRRIGFAGFGALVALSLGLVFASGSAAAPYEPNDSTLGAAGPLALNQTISAALETPGDNDFYFFYVTSPQPAQAALALSNLGGGSQSSDIQAIVTDAESTPLGGVSYVSAGESRTVALTLEPQKYFVEVAGNTGFGDTYSLTGAGTGAFGSYETIAGRCAAATSAAAKARRGLRRKQAKLQRATARLRRSRYSGRRARRTAQLAYRNARKRINAKRNQLKAARKSQQPWCSIPR